jgi:hypothetical protein
MKLTMPRNGPSSLIQPLKTPQNLLRLTLEKSTVYRICISMNRSQELKQAVQQVFAFCLKVRTPSLDFAPR